MAHLSSLPVHKKLSINPTPLRIAFEMHYIHTISEERRGIQILLGNLFLHSHLRKLTESRNFYIKHFLYTALTCAVHTRLQHQDRREKAKNFFFITRTWEKYIFLVSFYNRVSQLLSHRVHDFTNQQ